MILGLIVMSIHDPNFPVRKGGGHLLTASLRMPSPLDDDLPFPMCSSHCSQLLFTGPILAASLLPPRTGGSEGSVRRPPTSCTDCRADCGQPCHVASSALHSPAFATSQQVLQLLSAVHRVPCSGNITRANMACFSH